MVRKFSEKGAGLLVKTEIEALSRLLNPQEHPFVAVLGGAKVSDKIALLDSLIGRVDTFLLGGSLALTFLAAQGVSLGKSRIEEGKMHIAKRFLERAASHQAKVLLPVDHLVGMPGRNQPQTVVATNDRFPPDLAALDIGPKTAERFAEAVGMAKLVFWNGPLGLFEQPPFDSGTTAVARAAADCKGFVVVGGGDSAAALGRAGLSDKVAHVSTGGGASLEYIEGTVLPGLAALE